MSGIVVSPSFSNSASSVALDFLVDCFALGYPLERIFDDWRDKTGLSFPFSESEVRSAVADASFLSKVDVRRDELGSRLKVSDVLGELKGLREELKLMRSQARSLGNIRDYNGLVANELRSVEQLIRLLESREGARDRRVDVLKVSVLSVLELLEKDGLIEITARARLLERFGEPQKVVEGSFVKG